MRSRRLISFVILTMLVGLGSLMLSTAQVRAPENGDMCTIIIEKVAFPADNTEFDFSVTGGQNFDTTLKDPSDATFMFNIVAENDGNPTNVTEEVPPGWILDDIVCTSPNGTLCGNPDPPLPKSLVSPSPRSQTVSIFYA